MYPPGFEYLPDWITQAEEEELLRHIYTLSFQPVRMHGVVAKRQVVHFGWDYGYETWQIQPASPLPPWLALFRTRASSLMKREPEAIEQALVSQYPVGAGSWHRDAPMFGSVVVGFSLLGTCRMRFQRNQNGQREVAECLLKPRLAYVLCDAFRFIWQHCIPPTKQLRYSVTFQTVKNTRKLAL